MHDPKFEREVQRKMQELEFVPSEEVWANIQHGIAPRERRRAVAFFWWWLFPGVLLLGGGVMLYRHSGLNPGVAAQAPRGRVEQGDAGKGSVGVAEKGSVGDGGNAGAEGSVASGADGKTVNGVDRKVVDGKAAAENRGDGKVGKEAGRGVNADVAGVDGKAADGAAGADAGTEVGGAGQAGQVRARFGGYRPELIGGMASRAGVQAPWLYSQPQKTAVSGIRQPRRPWKAGFAAGGGVSTISEAGANSLVHAPTGGNAFAQITNVPVPSTMYTFANAQSGGSKLNTSSIKPGFSYWAGIFGEKPLSARWSVDIGLNLRYSSVQLQTTQPVYSYAPSSASLLTATRVTYVGNSSSSNSGSGMQTYLNQYYFLEVPVTVQWRITRSRALPVFWRGGAELSYLMSSNAVYYNSHTGNYEKDNAVARRAQVGVNTGIAVALPVRGVQIQAGPEVQYGLTSLLRAGTGGGHLAYGGLRVAVMR